MLKHGCGFLKDKGPQPFLLGEEGYMADLKSMRDAGLVVAIHNDYEQDGHPHTFYLMTYKEGRHTLAFKGEGYTDDEALYRIEVDFVTYVRERESLESVEDYIRNNIEIPLCEDQCIHTRCAVIKEALHRAFSLGEEKNIEANEGLYNALRIAKKAARSPCLQCGHVPVVLKAQEE